MTGDPVTPAATLRGKPVGPAIQARATLLDGEQARVAARALACRHRILQAIVVPASWNTRPGRKRRNWSAFWRIDEFTRRYQAGAYSAERYWPVAGADGSARQN